MLFVRSLLNIFMIKGIHLPDDQDVSRRKAQAYGLVAFEVFPPIYDWLQIQKCYKLILVSYIYEDIWNLWSC